MGIAAGIYTIINVFLNIYVLKRNPYYKKYVEQQEADLMSKAYTSQAGEMGVLQGMKMAAKVAKKTNCEWG